MPVIDTILDIIRTQRLTPEMERQLDTLLWSREFNSIELAALRRLETLIATGKIRLG